MSNARINLKAASILLFDPNSQSMAVLAQAMMGFGARTLLKAESFEAAQRHLTGTEVDMVICEATFNGAGEDGYDLIHWLRRSNLEPNAFAPAIITSSHASLRAVTRARDCGAHFIVAEPLIPAVLLSRIMWVANENRPFISCGSYVGPDRRFHNEGPPAGSEGRRAGDLSATVGEAKLPNMSQEEIDALMMPKRMNL